MTLDPRALLYRCLNEEYDRLARMNYTSLKEMVGETQVVGVKQLDEIGAKLERTVKLNNKNCLIVRLRASLSDHARCLVDEFEITPRGKRTHLYPDEHRRRAKHSPEEALAEYLRLEYGESRANRESIKAGDLEYVGEHVIDGVAVRYWSYPTSGEPMWATLTSLPEGETAGITSVPPPLTPRV